MYCFSTEYLNKSKPTKVLQSSLKALWNIRPNIQRQIHSIGSLTGENKKGNKTDAILKQSLIKPVFVKNHLVDQLLWMIVQYVSNFDNVQWQCFRTVLNVFASKTKTITTQLNEIDGHLLGWVHRDNNQTKHNLCSFHSKTNDKITTQFTVPGVLWLQTQCLLNDWYVI